MKQIYQETVFTMLHFKKILDSVDCDSLQAMSLLPAGRVLTSHKLKEKANPLF